MSFFKTETEPTITGTGVFARGFKNQIQKRSGGGARSGRDLNIGVSAIEDFVYSGRKLSDATMTALAKEIFGDRWCCSTPSAICW